MNNFLVLISVPPGSSETDCITVKKSILKKWQQVGFVLESDFSFSDCEITDLLSYHRLLLNHQWKNCHNISNHFERDFISDLSKWFVF